MSKVKFKRLTIIGVGLIGGSLARAVRQMGACDDIVGCGRDKKHLQQAVDLGVIDRFETDIATAVHGADMVVVATPLGAMETVFSAMSNQLAVDAVITDVGSAKVSVAEAACRTLGDRLSCFVPGHPIAGTEKSGVAASLVGLFENRSVILTPLAETSEQALARVRDLWSCTGAIISETTVDHHDQILAATSHLPHLLAYTLVDTLVSMDDSEEIFRYAAGGFRDFTRIASSDPIMWRDICRANKSAILDVMERYETQLKTLKQMLHDDRVDDAIEIFSRAKKARDKLVVKE